MGNDAIWGRYRITSGFWDVSDDMEGGIRLMSTTFSFGQSSDWFPVELFDHGVFFVFSRKLLLGSWKALFYVWRRRMVKVNTPGVICTGTT